MISTIDKQSIGYVRISGNHPADPQVKALIEIGVDPGHIYVDRGGKAHSDQKQLKEAIEHANAGTAVAVLSLDRLGHTLYDVVRAVELLRKHDLYLISIAESLDGRTPQGEERVNTLAGLAQVERDLIRERTSNGLSSARGRGRRTGPTPKMTPEAVKVALELLAETPPLSMNEITERMKPWIGKTAFFNWKKRYDDVNRLPKRKREKSHNKEKG